MKLTKNLRLFLMFLRGEKKHFILSTMGYFFVGFIIVIIAYLSPMILSSIDDEINKDERIRRVKISHVMEETDAEFLDFDIESIIKEDNEIFVLLRDYRDLEAFSNYITENGIGALQVFASNEIDFMLIKQIKSATIVVVILFAFLIVFSVSNITNYYIEEQTFKMSLLKQVGYTSSQVRSVILFSILITELLGLIIASILIPMVLSVIKIGERISSLISETIVLEVNPISYIYILLVIVLTIAMSYFQMKKRVTSDI